MSKSEATKERIMEATMKIAAERGFVNTRTAEIAREAGVSEGLIFKYFPTKSHLFRVIVELNFKQIKRGVEQIIADPKLDAPGKIRALIHFHLRHFAVKQNIIQLLLGHSEKKGLVDLEAVFQHAFRPYVGLIIQILEEGMAADSFRCCDPELTAMAIIGSMQVTLLSKLLTRTEFDVKLVERELTEYVLRAIGRYET
jgi:AcrR family transcriptional regulator